MGQGTPRTHCIRCGQCCMTSSPTLHIRDLHLIEDGFLRKDRLYTIRKGEMVRDNVNGGLTRTLEETIKIRESAGMNGGCVLYDRAEKACGIYEKRPVQCAFLKCWDTRDFMEIYKTPKVWRKDVIQSGVLLGLIAAHEDRCGYSLIEDRVKAIQREGETAVRRLIDLLKFDLDLRLLASKKLGIGRNDMDFFFGRPLAETITMYGLKVIRESDGSFLLTTD